MAYIHTDTDPIVHPRMIDTQGHYGKIAFKLEPHNRREQ